MFGIEESAPETIAVMPADSNVRWQARIVGTKEMRTPSAQTRVARSLMHLVAGAHVVATLLVLALTRLHRADDTNFVHLSCEVWEILTHQDSVRIRFQRLNGPLHIRTWLGIKRIDLADSAPKVDVDYRFRLSKMIGD